MRELIVTISGRVGFGPTEQEWGYVTVREGSHMFWWLHQVQFFETDFTEKPLIIWLQGGPGVSSTGFGNFAEIGPLDQYLVPRGGTSWIWRYNVLFVDSPVGTGYSYVDNEDAFATNNSQIAQDFVVLLQGFYETVPNLTDTPLYIFSESYGGKMAVEIALEIDQAIEDGILNINLVGVGLGDSWISPIGSALFWSTYLLTLSGIDQNGFGQIQASALEIKNAVDDGNFVGATDLWKETEQLISNLTTKIDFCNILNDIYIEPVAETRRVEQDDIINWLMNGQVKDALGLDVEWGAQSEQVFQALYEDLLKPVTEKIELLLNTTNIRVIVYNGQLDLIINTLGTMMWIDQLNFDGTSEWKTVERKPILVSDFVEGYYKKVGNLGFYWIVRAGQMVPADNPSAMFYVLNDTINGEWKTVEDSKSKIS